MKNEHHQLFHYCNFKCKESKKHKGTKIKQKPSTEIHGVMEAKKQHHQQMVALGGGGGIMTAWALRSRFHSLIAIFVAVVFVATVYLTGKDTSTMTRIKARKVVSNGVFYSGGCDMFSGKWVFDNSTYPLYSEKQCTYMSDQLACEKFGRKDLSYQNWRWQPNQCDLPRFNATALLERLRGKGLVFVGDSLNRGQWVSMVCLVETVIPPSLKSMETNGSLITFKAIEYNATIEFYWAPLLVESNSDDPVNHRIPDRIVRAQGIEKHARYWTDADILVFNSYLWWRRPKMKVLWGSFGSSDGMYKEIEILRSYEMALKTWSDWLEIHVNHTKTQLFWVSMSPTHFWGEEWGMPSSDQNCYNETQPITKQGHKGRGSDPKMMEVVETAIEGLKVKGVHVQMLNITQLSEYRKEGHPSVYRKQWEPLTEEQTLNPSSYSDCIHWCLPGVPDAWNELLNAYIFS